MRTYKELLDLATSCAKSARATTSEQVAYSMWQMALEYQQEAAKLDGGKLPDIGHPPTILAPTGYEVPPLGNAANKSLQTDRGGGKRRPTIAVGSYSRFSRE